MVAVKNHHHGVSNPKAQMRFEITIEQVLNAPMVVEPFGLYDCTPQSDGAAAVLLVGEEVVDRYTERPVWVRGVGLGLDRVMHQHKPDMTTFPPTVKAARKAYAMAGIGPGDIDVAEVHDCFTGVELIDYEDLGFCDRFGGAALIESGETAVGGRLPVNPSGGLKAKGHPPGATGIAQCVELFEQLRGESTNQVDGKRARLRAQHRWPHRGVGGHHPGVGQGLIPAGLSGPCAAQERTVGVHQRRDRGSRRHRHLRPPAGQRAERPGVPRDRAGVHRPAARHRRARGDIHCRRRARVLRRRRPERLGAPPRPREGGRRQHRRPPRPREHRARSLLGAE